jgi:hypothetical protein
MLEPRKRLFNSTLAIAEAPAGTLNGNGATERIIE